MKTYTILESDLYELTVAAAKIAEIEQRGIEIDYGRLDDAFDSYSYDYAAHEIFKSVATTTFTDPETCRLRAKLALYECAIRQGSLAMTNDQFIEVLKLQKFDDQYSGRIYGQIEKLARTCKYFLYVIHVKDNVITANVNDATLVITLDSVDYGSEYLYHVVTEVEICHSSVCY